MNEPQTDGNIRKCVQREIETQDPPIVVGSIWISGTSETGEIYRRVRILGDYPKGGPFKRGNDGTTHIIVEELAAKFTKTSIGEIHIIAEFNLRYYARPEEVDDGS